MVLQMQSSECGLIVARNLSKHFEIYEKPVDRIKQVLFGSEQRKYFRAFEALTDVSFEIHRGASLGVIGRNGAGKSTLLQLITGTVEPTSGSVSVTGKVAAVLELGAGFNMEFSGRENIELYCNLLQMTPELIRDRFDRIVEFSELSQFIDQPLKTYSSGMIARLAFSVIAHVDADILIIDEALSVGDAAFSQKCMRFLHEFRERGTIFFVSHDLSAIKAFCDSAIWIDAGRVRAIGDSRTVCDAYMSDIYPNKAATPMPTAVQAQPASKTLPKHSPEPLAGLAGRGAAASSPPSQPNIHGSQRLEAFSFNSMSGSFGNGAAEIVALHFSDISGTPLSFCSGRQSVKVSVHAHAHQAISSPIIGFFVKDRLGQPLFGTNTYLAYASAPVTAVAGQMLKAVFVFDLPTLMVGEYSISAAIADGSLASHTQLHWLHDAANFRVTESTLDGVLVGIPMHKIELEVLEETTN
jgi:lipopolysaccharide transport system ATP-binding protein